MGWDSFLKNESILSYWCDRFWRGFWDYLLAKIEFLEFQMPNNGLNNTYNSLSYRPKSVIWPKSVMYPWPIGVIIPFLKQMTLDSHKTTKYLAKSFLTWFIKIPQKFPTKNRKKISRLTARAIRNPDRNTTQRKSINAMLRKGKIIFADFNYLKIESDYSSLTSLSINFFYAGASCSLSYCSNKLQSKLLNFMHLRHSLTSFE